MFSTQRARIAGGLVAALVAAVATAVSTAKGAERPALADFVSAPWAARPDVQPTALRGIARGDWSGGPIVASTGETVTLYVSDDLPPDDAARQTWANFFAWLYHGSELATVTIYQEPIAQVHETCGSQYAMGCYSPVQKALVFPGDLSTGVEADIAAHEYGHHIAANRRNDPWVAGDWGPKRWATDAGICTRVAAGTAFPGDEEEHYMLNPGEAFADVYKVLNQQRGGTWGYLPFVVDASFIPDAAALAAAQADVQQPWLSTTPKTWDGTFARPARPLQAGVGPDATIWLRNAAGTALKAVRSSDFAITVRDSSARDNFHLVGPGVNRRTGVAGKSTVSWTVTLQPGFYRYYSDAHPKLGSGFIVNEAPATAQGLQPQSQTIATPLDGVLDATVTGTANARIELVDAATGRDLVAATPGHLAFTICGQRSVVLRVLPTNAGSFHVALAAP
jgi:hypothetical protein